MILNIALYILCGGFNQRNRSMSYASILFEFMNNFLIVRQAQYQNMASQFKIILGLNHI